MANLNKVTPVHSPRPAGTPQEVDGGDYGQGFKYDPDFQGPTGHRKCTDILCLLLFLAFLGGWAFVGVFAISKGDINKVIMEKSLSKFIF